MISALLTLAAAGADRPLSSPIASAAMHHREFCRLYLWSIASSEFDGHGRASLVDAVCGGLAGGAGIGMLSAVVPVYIAGPRQSTHAVCSLRYGSSPLL